MSFVPHMPCEWCERKDAEINRQSVRLVELTSKLEDYQIRIRSIQQTLLSIARNKPAVDGVVDVQISVELLKQMADECGPLPGSV
jgi:hypothetical protein